MALRARTAVVAVFAANGVVFAAFLSRTPALRDDLGLSTAELGLLLLCLSGGAVVGLPLSGPIVQRVQPTRAVAGGAVTVALGLAALAAALYAGSVPPAAVGLAVTGLGMGVWDVAMNVEGAAVERRLERSLLPRLHAAFSLGTVAGALLGAAAAAAGIALSAQVLVVGLAAPLVAVFAARAFLPGQVQVRADEHEARSIVAWREPRTLLVGLLVLAFAFTEGTANDWIAVALVDGYGTSESVGALAFGVFVTAMTLGRLFGGQAVDRVGRVVVLRVTAALALAGLLLVVLGDAPAVALAGAALWGLGASLGFPLGISAAADDPARSAARVSVVTTIGYTAFLAGPPLIGLLAERSGILDALVVTLGALVLGLVLAGAARPLTPGRARAS